MEERRPFKQSIVTDDGIRDRRGLQIEIPFEKERKVMRRASEAFQESRTLCFMMECL